MPKGTPGRHLSDLTDTQLDCRELGHWWDRRTAVYWKAVGRQVNREITCVRCGSVKRERFSPDGSGRTTSMRHSEAYLLEHPLGRSYRRQVRREVLCRVTTIWENLEQVP